MTVHEIFTVRDSYTIITLVFFMQLNTSNSCHFKFTVTFPLALDNFETLLYNERKIVDLCSNFITASVAFTVESVSFIILAYTKINGSSFIIGVSEL